MVGADRAARPPSHNNRGRPQAGGVPRRHGISCGVGNPPAAQSAKRE
jgi:hypothetical protein